MSPRGVPYQPRSTLAVTAMALLIVCAVLIGAVVSRS